MSIDFRLVLCDVGQPPTMRATGSSSAPRSPTSGVGIVWRVARAQGVPNDILVRNVHDIVRSASSFSRRFIVIATHILTLGKMWQVVDAFDPNSSAAEADLRQGDILSRVDGVDVIGMPVPTVAEKIFGPIGSPVRLSRSPSNNCEQRHTHRPISPSLSPPPL